MPYMAMKGAWSFDRVFEVACSLNMRSHIVVPRHVKKWVNVVYWYGVTRGAHHVKNATVGIWSFTAPY